MSTRSYKDHGGLTTLATSVTIEKLREMGINNVRELTSHTSHQLISLFSKMPLHELTIRALAKNMLKRNHHFADGEEATRNLITYSPKTYKPSAEPLRPGIPAPSDPVSEAKPGTQASEAVDVPTDDPSPASLETALREIGRAIDTLKEKVPSLSHLSISANFKDANGKGHRIAINDMNLSPAE